MLDDHSVIWESKSLLRLAFGVSSVERSAWLLRPVRQDPREIVLRRVPRPGPSASSGGHLGRDLRM